jgi:hypothetical protein
MRDDTPRAEQSFRRGDIVRCNMRGCRAEHVIAVSHPMVTTDRDSYHWTKLVLLHRDKETDV